MKRLKYGNRQNRQRLDRHGTIVVGSCETFHHYNVQDIGHFYPFGLITYHRLIIFL